MRPQGSTLCFYRKFWVVGHLCVCVTKSLWGPGHFTQALTSWQIQAMFWCHIYSAIVSSFFFTFFLRPSALEANCFWASGEWEDFNSGLLLHLPGCPGRAGRVHAWWSRSGSGWVPVLPHGWPPRGHREDGDIHRTAYKWRPQFGYKPGPTALSRYHKNGRE